MSCWSGARWRSGASEPGGVTAAREETPLGPVWRVTGPDGRSRTHPSISGALRHLRSLVAPERRASRVLFMRAGDGEPQ